MPSKSKESDIATLIGRLLLYTALSCDSTPPDGVLGLRLYGKGLLPNPEDSLWKKWCLHGPAWQEVGHSSQELKDRAHESENRDERVLEGNERPNS